MGTWTRKIEITQAGGSVTADIIPDDVALADGPSAWSLQIEAYLTSDAGLASPPLATPTAGRLSVAVKAPGALGFTPFPIGADGYFVTRAAGAADIGPSVHVTSLPITIPIVGPLESIRLQVSGLDANKTLRATLNASTHTPDRTLMRRSFRETVATNAASSDVIIPYGDRPTVRLIGFADPGRAVQFTTSPEAMIWSGTAVWRSWPFGSIVGDGTGRATGAMTGLRLTTTGGAGTWEVVS